MKKLILLSLSICSGCADHIAVLPSHVQPSTTCHGGAETFLAVTVDGFGLPTLVPGNNQESQIARSQGGVTEQIILRFDERTMPWSLILVHTLVIRNDHGVVSLQGKPLAIRVSSLLDNKENASLCSFAFSGDRVSKTKSKFALTVKAVNSTGILSDEYRIRK